MRKNSLILAALALFSFSSWAFAEDHKVEIVSDYENMRMYFKPKLLQIKKGDTITWINLANEQHNVISYPDGFPKNAKGFQSPFFFSKAGQTWTHQFTESGTYNYHCIPHLFMGMTGSVIVDKASSEDDFYTPTPKEVLAYREQLLQFFDEDQFEHAPDYVRLKQRMAHQRMEKEKTKTETSSPTEVK